MSLSEEALPTVAAWLERWAVHVVGCAGDPRCTCGLTAVRNEASVALSELAEGVAALQQPAEQIAENANCSEGWVLVPREPTLAMTLAGATDKTPNTASNSVDRMFGAVALIYKAMISAAPLPQRQAGEPTREAVARKLAELRGHRDLEAAIWINDERRALPVWHCYLNDADQIQALYASPLPQQPVAISLDEIQAAKQFADTLLVWADGCVEARQWGGPTIYPEHPVSEQRARAEAHALTALLAKLEGKS